MATKPLPTPTELRQLLRYEPETGKLLWRERGPQWFSEGYRLEPGDRRQGQLIFGLVCANGFWLVAAKLSRFVTPLRSIPQGQDRAALRHKAARIIGTPALRVKRRVRRLKTVTNTSHCPARASTFRTALFMRWCTMNGRTFATISTATHATTASGICGAFHRRPTCETHGCGRTTKAAQRGSAGWGARSVGGLLSRSMEDR